MRKVPNMIFIIDTNIESLAVKEAMKLKIPIIKVGSIQEIFFEKRKIIILLLIGKKKFIKIVVDKQFRHKK